MREAVDRLATALEHCVDNIAYLDVVDSTHSMCQRLIDQMDDENFRLEGTVVLASRQSGGIGRTHRRWVSPPGGLYVNWLRCGLPRETIGQLPMLAAAAAHAAITGLGVGGAAIKWPNDIVVGGEKLAGILVYARHGALSWATVGLGVNLSAVPEVSNADLQPTAVVEHIPPAPLQEWCMSIVQSFVPALSASLDDAAPALAAWRRHLVHRPGDTLNVRLASGTRVTGTFIGLTKEGFLRLQQRDRELTISTGDVVEG